jgi:hypothetical protein
MTAFVTLLAQFLFFAVDHLAYLSFYAIPHEQHHVPLLHPHIL